MDRRRIAMISMNRGIVWFKKDLRVEDNPALFNACHLCEEGVIGVYIIDIEMWKKHFTSHCQIEFILDGLQKLTASLEALNIPLIIKNIESTQKIPTFLFSLAEKYQANKLFFNKELEVNESRRDKSVVEFFAKKKCAVLQFNDQLILTEDNVRTQQNEYFKVFTPFKREWLKVFQQKNPTLLKKPKIQKKLNITSSIVPNKLPGIKSLSDLSLWPAGEKIAKKKLAQFLDADLFSYDKQRDYPMMDSTSKLSPYLALGMISAKTCFHSALVANDYELDTGNQGALIWMSELIWREFYRHILIAVPRVGMNKPYQQDTERLSWNVNSDHLQRWQQGLTGYPLVDAAMRQLNAIGWMHNRLRMITAMFLSKNLFLDWRLGEKYFASRLIDFDFPSNNGGWQWSASTGTDAVPYFRMFNPISQSQKFDNAGDFIRFYCPELKNFDNRSIHDPYKYNSLLASQVGYPLYVVDYAESRKRTLAAFMQIKKQNKSKTKP